MARKAATAKGKTKKPAEPYVPTERERIAHDRQDARIGAHAPRPGFKLHDQDGNVVRMMIDHPDPRTAARLMMESFGTDDVRVLDALSGGLAQLSRVDDSIDVARHNEMVALVQNIAPMDAVEAMLATQMAAIHQATMAAAAKLKSSTLIPQQDSNGNLLNKLARTFAAQTEALKRYRTGGVQKVLVQHVQVNDGGQAIVNGEVQGGGGVDKKEHQSHERPDGLRIPEGQAVLSYLETDPLPMPSASALGQERVPVPRRTRGSTRRAA